MQVSNTARAQGWLRSPGAGQVTSPVPQGSPTRLDPSPPCSRAQLLGVGSSGAQESLCEVENL